MKVILVFLQCQCNGAKKISPFETTKNRSPSNLHNLCMNRGNELGYQLYHRYIGWQWWRQCQARLCWCPSSLFAFTEVLHSPIKDTRPQEAKNKTSYSLPIGTSVVSRQSHTSVSTSCVLHVLEQGSRSVYKQPLSLTPPIPSQVHVLVTKTTVPSSKVHVLHSSPLGGTYIIVPVVGTPSPSFHCVSSTSPILNQSKISPSSYNNANKVVCYPKADHVGIWHWSPSSNPIHYSRPPPLIHGIWSNVAFCSVTSMVGTLKGLQQHWRLHEIMVIDKVGFFKFFVNTTSIHIMYTPCSKPLI